jgi:hypothetical protein
VHREFRLPVEHPATLEFRAEAYKMLNHPQFAAPGATVGTSTFGVITATSNPIVSFNSHCGRYFNSLLLP